LVAECRRGVWIDKNEIIEVETEEITEQDSAKDTSHLYTQFPGVGYC